MTKPLFMSAFLFLGLAATPLVAQEMNSPPGPAEGTTAAPTDMGQPVDPAMTSRGTTDGAPVSDMPAPAAPAADASANVAIIPGDSASTAPTNAMPPQAAKDYPVCTRTVTDSCINPGEARKARTRK